MSILRQAAARPAVSEFRDVGAELHLLPAVQRVMITQGAPTLAVAMPLYACGSNTASHLALGHANDVHTLTACAFHPSIVPVLPGANIIDLVSASAHTLLLLQVSDGTHLLLGAGTNTLGQLGPKCALWDHVKPQTSFKGVDLKPPELDGEDWEPVRIAAAWTTSYVVYRKISTAAAGSALSQEDDEDADEVLVACGSNDFNELGLSSVPDGPHTAITRASDLPNIVQLGMKKGDHIEHLKAGQRHAVVVISTGRGAERTQRVVGWGAARKGELDGHTLSVPSTSASSFDRTSVSAKGKGKSRAAVHPTSLPPTAIELPIPKDSHIVDLALGSSHSVALLSDSRVLAWGSDQKGQITGLGRDANAIGVDTTWSGTYLLHRVSTAVEVCAQGWNTISHRATASTDRSSILLPAEYKPERLVTGSEHLLLLARPRSTSVAEGPEQLFVGGWNEHGNLGLGDTTDRNELVPLSLDLMHGPVRGLWGGCASTWVWAGEGVC